MRKLALKLRRAMVMLLATAALRPDLALAAEPVAAAILTPKVHADFTYYTFALTWQPGICETDEGCTPDQPHATLIGLHGLWASLPQSLIDEGVVPQQWWKRGCDYLEHSDAAPPLDADLSRQLDAVMPHFEHSLLIHEYDKHVECFHFDPTTFFRTELALRKSVVESGFGRYLQRQAGHDIAHTALEAAFVSAFATDHGKSLQLQCRPAGDGRVVLTQLWISIPADALAAFPQPRSLIDAPIAQDTCPPVFRVPTWPG